MMAGVNLQVLLHQLLGALLLPPFTYLLPIVAGLCLLRSRPRLARALLWGSALLAWLLSLPVTAMQLNGWLERYPPADLAQVQQTQAIVVLSGGKKPAPEYAANVLSADSAGRVRYAAWLVRRSGLPLLLSGGAPLGGEPEARVMARTLQEDYALPPRWVEDQSNTTLQNAQLSARLLRQAGITRVTLVTQAWHMRRALPFFRQQGLQVLPAPTGFTRYDGDGVLNWIPQGRALQENHQALRELLGTLYYAVGSLMAG
ncbi:YdcF family protein [Vogesella oryzae]|uniref:YdcF family protein n=1 Tax=Vogesella oryzae TaxID=1735285 RepID=UPI0015824FD2|nr:YdcF family protein [Vogesella oryzae]